MITLKINELKHNGVLIKDTYEKNIKSLINKLSGKEKEFFESNEVPYLTKKMIYNFCAINPDLDCIKNNKFLSRVQECIISSYKNGGDKLDFILSKVPVIREAIAKIKDELKEENKKNKEQIKIEKEKEKERYGFAIVNGEKEPLAGYIIEPEGFFHGRGESKLNGYWKFKTEEKDVELNWISDEKPPIGDWKITSKSTRHEIATYYVKIGTCDKVLATVRKKVQFGQNSSLKNEADFLKFKFAEEFENNIDLIHTMVYNGLLNKEEEAVLTDIMLVSGLRIGNEPKEDIFDANTIGISQIKKENIKITGVDKIYLSFLGKDSVPFESELAIDKLSVKWIENKLSKIGDKDRVFSENINLKAYFEKNGINCYFTPKVIRTYVANRELKNYLYDNSNYILSEIEKINIFKSANLEVAKVLNHQKNVNKSFDENFKKLEDKLQIKKESFMQYNKDSLQKLKELDSKIERAKAINDSTLEKFYTDKKEKIVSRLSKKESSLKKSEYTLSFKNKTKNIALGTSIQSYISPKVVKEWCDIVGLDVSKIYNKSQMERFNQFFTEN